MYISNGWQNVRDYSQKNIPFSIRRAEIPAAHAHAVIGYTEARNESLPLLIADLKAAAGVARLRYNVVEG